MSKAEVLEQIDKLPLAERQEVAEIVLQKYGNLDDALTPEQAAELDRRLAEFENNPHDGIPWEQVEADINKRFGWQ
jgi:putative addiction module component (TIGR02574 family)